MRSDLCRLWRELLSTSSYLSVDITLERRIDGEDDEVIEPNGIDKLDDDFKEDVLYVVAASGNCK
jgi:hypothetical protein